MAAAGPSPSPPQAPRPSPQKHRALRDLQLGKPLGPGGARLISPQAARQLRGAAAPKKQAPARSESDSGSGSGSGSASDSSEESDSSSKASGLARQLGLRGLVPSGGAGDRKERARRARRGRGPNNGLFS